MDYYKIRELAYPYNYVESITAIISSIFGTILSILVLYIILKNKWKSLSIDLKLICFTLLSDLLMCFFAFISAICNLFGFAEYLNSPFSCAFNAVTIVFTAITSVNLVGVVALERYFLIVEEKVLRNRSYYMVILGQQLMSLISIIIGGVFRGFNIGTTSLYCIYDTETWAGIAGTVILLSSICISIFMIYYSYISIMIKRRKLTLKNLKIFPFKAAKIKKDANSTMLKSSLIIAASTITILPYCILLFISLINPKFLTPLFMALFSMLPMLNMVTNTIIVLRMRIGLWNELKVLLLIKSDNSDADNDIIDDYQLNLLS